MRTIRQCHLWLLLGAMALATGSLTGCVVANPHPGHQCSGCRHHGPVTAEDDVLRELAAQFDRVVIGVSHEEPAPTAEPLPPPPTANLDRPAQPTAGGHRQAGAPPPAAACSAPPQGAFAPGAAGIDAPPTLATPPGRFFPLPTRPVFSGSAAGYWGE